MHIDTVTLNMVIFFSSAQPCGAMCFTFAPILHQSTHALSVSKELRQGGKTDLCTGVNTIHAYMKIFVLLLN